ncbi:hypothetical protein L208DRAFT_1506354 [Tricholoma matsutake]|nr:hypothetical protein L208DRAFT_1506354 [Tricholoma matsutake 945]
MYIKYGIVILITPVDILEKNQLCAVSMTAMLQTPSLRYQLVIVSAETTPE